MVDLFDFDLPAAVTEQLERRLHSMPSSTFTEEALRDLGRFQEQNKIRQGVYQLLMVDEVVYIGKAGDVHERLRQHFGKLRGRLRVNMDYLRFKCLLLHGNWSMSANEDLLIAHYKSKKQCRWNSSGFGAKDVGRERDGTEPNWFDLEYPINADYPCVDIPDRLTIRELLVSLKAQLPFTFRYERERAKETVALDLKGVPRTARALLTAVLRELGRDWQATILRSHIILYTEQRSYRHGEVITLPRSAEATDLSAPGWLL